jgi:hypothetical protein
MTRNFENFKDIKLCLGYKLNDPSIRISSEKVLKLNTNTVNKEDYSFFCMDHYLFLYILNSHLHL